MTDAEKDALTWLDRMLACSNPGTDAERSVLTLKAMLAEPRMPKEPNAWMLDAMIVPAVEFSAMAPVERRRRVYDALYDHLTKPTTKKRWGVSAGCGWVHFDTFVKAMEALEGEACSGKRAVTIEFREAPT